MNYNLVIKQRKDKNFVVVRNEKNISWDIMDLWINNFLSSEAGELKDTKIEFSESKEIKKNEPTLPFFDDDQCFDQEEHDGR